jgi:Ni,Fe-hydrogenase I small subunit
VYEGKRQIATIPYGGAPQDEEVTAIRRKLYEQVIKDNLKPKLDETGRPQFFFLQNDAKACYTEGGLGMGVYDWRTPFVKANEVGIELELQKEGLAAS